MAKCRKTAFKRVITTTPILIVGIDMYRQAIVFFNETTSVGARIGPSGSGGMQLAIGEGFTDSISIDEWWAWTDSGTGTVSGLIYTA